MIDTEKLDKLQRYSRVIAGLSLTLFFALIVVSFWSLWRVRKEIANLEEKKQELTQQVTDTTQQVDKVREELQALEAQKAWLNKTISEIAKQRPESVKAAINQVNADPPDKAPIGQKDRRAEYARQAIEQMIQTAPSVARNLPRVYLHISDEKQLSRARLIARQLKQAGYVVPGIEDVGASAPRGVTQVRCNARSDAERNEGQDR